MTRSGSFARNVVSNWVVLAANITYAVLLTPLIVRTLGVERYGVWSFLNGLVAYSDLLYLGLGSALVKFAAQFRAQDDQAGLNRLVSVVVTIYAGLGLICLAILIVLSGYVPRMFAEPLSPGAAHAASIVCILLGVRLVFVFVSSAFAGLLSSQDRFDLVNGVQLLGALVRLVLTPVLLARPWDPLLTIAWITAAGVALDALLLPIVAFRLLPRLSVWPSRPRAGELQWLYAFGLQSFFVLFAVKLISYTDTTVIGLTLGAASVGAYTLPLQLVEYGRMAIGGFSGVFLPQLTILMTRGQADELRNTLVSASRIGFFMAAWTCSSLIVLGPPFLNRWIGSSVGTDTQYVLVFLAIASWLHVIITQIPLAFYQALHLMVRPAKILIVEAMLNVILSVILAPWLGITGVALATLLPVVFVSFLTLPPYLSRHVKLPFRSYVAQSLPAGLVLFVLNLIAQLLLRELASVHSYPLLLARALASIPVAAAVFWFMFPPDERERIVQTISRTPSAKTATL